MLKFIKLINGEEIVADVDEEELTNWSEKMSMRKPFRNLMVQGGNSALIPYPCEEISVSTSHVLFTGDPNVMLEQAYCEMTGRVYAVRPSLQMPRE
jgi:hypothetical protein